MHRILVDDTKNIYEVERNAFIIVCDLLYNSYINSFFTNFNDQFMEKKNMIFHPEKKNDKND